MQRSVLLGSAALSLAVFAGMPSNAVGTVIIADDFNTSVEAVPTTGFNLNEGVNYEINPPTSTRLTGTAAADLRWIPTFVGKPSTSYLIHNENKFRVNSGAQSGRASLSADGTTPFDFGSALGTGSATSAAPLEYDITISMDNNSNATERMSFAFGTAEGATGVWDFGLQLYRSGTETYYTAQKRFDLGSTGLAADLNAEMAELTTKNTGSEVDFVIRVTDAGSESGSDYNSRIQVSIDGGTTWLYDTDTDAALTNGFRFDGASRFVMFDIAGGNSSFVTYDNFSIDAVPEPGTIGLAVAAGAMLLARRRRR